MNTVVSIHLTHIEDGTRLRLEYRCTDSTHVIDMAMKDGKQLRDALDAVMADADRWRDKIDRRMREYGWNRL